MLTTIYICAFLERYKLGIVEKYDKTKILHVIVPHFRNLYPNYTFTVLV